VVLISVDTLRSDHVSAYGSRVVQTPNIDRLAHDGVLFEHAYSNVPLTLPSHTTIMTGLLPPEHGVRDNAGSRLSPSIPTIASLLRARGFATGAAVSAWILRRDTNLSSGFDFYDDGVSFVEGAPTGDLQRDGAATVKAITQWIAGHRTRPFFAFVHLFEPHTPYMPSYDADVARADGLVGEILDSLRAQSIYDDSLIILVSDHGEGLGDHGEAEHGVLLYREALQVPVIVKLPHSERAGTRVSAAAQLADILPTIAEVTGTAPPTKLRGASLLHHLPSRVLYAETIYPQIHLGWSDLRSVVRYPLHLVSGPRPELYDLGTDARETVDLRATRRREAADLAHALETFPHPSLLPASVDGEERKKLAALGYVDAGSAAASSLNPRDHLPELAELQEVTVLMQRRDYAAAATRMETLLARNPQWSDLRDDLATAYSESGDLARAERVYRDGIRMTPQLRESFALSLAPILAQEGKFDDALAHARLALQSNPDGAHEVLARIALARKDYTGAAREIDAMRASGASSIVSDTLNAEILTAQGRRAEAWQLLERARATAAVSRDALPRRYWFLAGDTLAGLGRVDEARAAFERAIAADAGDREAYVALAFLNAATGDRAAAELVLSRMTSAIPQSAREADTIRREIAAR
jgi:arylsulfatase A-like enzyme/Tfp pilus assembly protein PilF